MKIDFNDDIFVSVYDNCPLWSSQFGYTILDKIDFKENANVLDIGTGTGFPAIDIAERMGNKSVVYAIDHWSTALKRAEIKASQLDVNNVIFKNASVLDIPFEDNFFDLVVSNNCLNNVYEYDKALKECYRVLKPGGRIVQTFNLPDTFHEFYDIFKALLSEKEMTNEIETLNNYIVENRKSTEFTEKATEQAGLRVVEATEHSFLWRFYNGTSLFNYSFVKMVWLSSWQNIIKESQRESFFSEFEKRLNIYAQENKGLNLKIPYSCVIAEKQN